MDRKLRTWKLALGRFSQDPAPDYREIARLVTEMAVSDEITLRQAATQAMPSLRNAMAKKSDHVAREIVRRRLGLIQAALHALTAPQFGKRSVAPKVPAPEERYRQMLGLPLDRTRWKFTKPTRMRPRECIPITAATDMRLANSPRRGMR